MVAERRVYRGISLLMFRTLLVCLLSTVIGTETGICIDTLDKYEVAKNAQEVFQNEFYENLCQISPPSIEISPTFAMYLLLGAAFMCCAGLYFATRRDKGGPDIRIIRDDTPPPPAPSGEVMISRWGEIIGGTYTYKVKIENGSYYVIKNVMTKIVAYPRDCMKLDDAESKTINRINSGRFGTVSFSLSPTASFVKGEIRATVSYLDNLKNICLENVESLEVGSVCGFLNPLETSVEDFKRIISGMKATSEEQTLQWNSEILFLKTKALLTFCNFHVVDAKRTVENGQLRGEISGLAVGKTTDEKMAVQLSITGLIDGNDTRVIVMVLGESVPLLQVALGEVLRGLDSWTCINCGATLEVNQVTTLQSNQQVTCRSCQQSLTIDRYKPRRRLAPVSTPVPPPPPLREELVRKEDVLPPVREIAVEEISPEAPAPDIVEEAPVREEPTYIRDERRGKAKDMTVLRERLKRLDSEIQRKKRSQGGKKK